MLHFAYLGVSNVRQPFLSWRKTGFHAVVYSPSSYILRSRNHDMQKSVKKLVEVILLKKGKQTRDWGGAGRGLGWGGEAFIPCLGSLSAQKCGRSPFDC